MHTLRRPWIQYLDHTDIKYEKKALPFLVKYVNQWHNSYWSSNWFYILNRLPPLNGKDIKRGIHVSLLLETEKWLRNMSANESSCYAGWHKWIWHSKWADEYCTKNNINRIAFGLESKGVNVKESMNQDVDWV